MRARIADLDDCLLPGETRSQVGLFRIAGRCSRGVSKTITTAICINFMHQVVFARESTEKKLPI
jgi:hypothetical protein